MRKKRKKKHVPAAVALGIDGLEQPFPSSPSRPPKFSIYCRYPHNAPMGEARRFVWTFSAAYAARHFIDRIIGEDKFKWKRRNIIQTARGVEIRVLDEDDGLETVMEYEMTRAEEAWQIPEPRCRELETFLRPLGDEARTEPHAARTTAPRASRDGLVSMAQICARVGIEPRDGRAALRRARIDKPDAGWAWAADEAVKIEKLLSKSR